MYSTVWFFEVAPGCKAEFEGAYNGDGDWVRLFRRAAGYVRTELHRDLELPGRYLTVDYWASSEAYAAFRRSAAEQYRILDRKCESLTVTERHLGSFLCLERSGPSRQRPVPAGVPMRKGRS